MHDPEFMRLYDQALTAKQRLEKTIDLRQRQFLQDLINGLIDEMAKYKKYNAVKIHLSLENSLKVLGGNIC